MDGTGVHSGQMNEYDVTVVDEARKQYSLLEKLEYNMRASSYFLQKFGGYTALGNN